MLYSLDPSLLCSPKSMAPSLFCPYPHTLGSLLSFSVSTVVSKTNSVTFVPAPRLNQSLFPVPAIVLDLPKWLPNMTSTQWPSPSFLLDVLFSLKCASQADPDSYQIGTENPYHCVLL